MTTTFPPHIETERLRLRPPIIQDAEAIFDAYTQDPAVCRFMVWIPHGTLETTARFIDTCIQAWRTSTAFPYIITSKTNGQVLGMLEARPAQHRANIGYVLARAHWGQGIMPEALRAFAEIALSNPGFFRVEATCDVENQASARTLEKSGFSREGRLARYVVHPNLSPEPRDCWMYARCR